MDNRTVNDTNATGAEGLDLFGEARILAATILKTVDALLCILDRDGRFVWFNHVCEELTGYRREEVLGKAIWDIFIVSGEVESVKKVFEDLRAGNFPNRHVNFWKTKAGGRKTIAWANSAICDDAGHVVLVVGTGIDVTERVAAETALHASEQLLRNVIDLIPHAVWARDAEGRFLLANRATAAGLGLTVKELTGARLTDVGVDREEAARVLEADREAIAAGEPLSTHEEICTDAAGEKHVVETSRVPFPTETGSGQAVLGLSIDVTERRATDERLRLLSLAVDQSFEGLAVIDMDGRVELINPAFARMHGYEPEEVQGRHVSIFHTPEQMPEVAAIFRRVSEDGRFDGEVAHARRDGSVFAGMMHVTMFRNAKNEPVGILGLLRDVTAQKKTEEALQRSEELYRTTINALPIGVVTLNRDLRILFVNEIVRQWNLQAGRHVDPVGRMDRDAFPFLQPRVEEEYGHVLASGLPVVSEERHELGDRTVIFEVRKIPVFEDGQVVRIITLLEDITERKQIEETMRSASRMEATARLAGGIAHDFNNLMTNVLGYAELLAVALEGNADACALLGRIAKAAQRAGELAQLLVAYARGGKYQSQVVSLNDVVGDTITLQERSFPPRIAIERLLAPDLWNVEADPVQMQQVLMNLCINAVEAIPDKGRVTIRTRNVTLKRGDKLCAAFLKPGRHACLSVEDTGHGMDEKTLARVFEPFYTTKTQGRGLGLAAVYGIVKNHGGALNVQSVLGKGSVFEVYFPAVDAPRSAVKKRAEGGVPCGRETVLIIDDEASIVELGQRVLEQLGYRVLPATTGERAIEIVHTFDGTIHAAILDIGMPGIGGAELLPLLKKARPGIRVMICSGYEPEDAARELKNRGADGFLQKPFRIDQLGRALRQVLDG